MKCWATGQQNAQGQYNGDPSRIRDRKKANMPIFSASNFWRKTSSKHQEQYARKSLPCLDCLHLSEFAWYFFFLLDSCMILACCQSKQRHVPLLATSSAGWFPRSRNSALWIDVFRAARVEASSQTQYESKTWKAGRLECVHKYVYIIYTHIHHDLFELYEVFTIYAYIICM